MEYYNFSHHGKNIFKKSVVCVRACMNNSYKYRHFCLFFVSQQIKKKARAKILPEVIIYYLHTIKCMYLFLNLIIFPFQCCPEFQTVLCKGQSLMTDLSHSVNRTAF